MRRDDKWQQKDVQVHHDGDVLVITLDGATWRVRITLTPEGITLTDAATGTVLCEQDLASLGIKYREGKHYPEKREREQLLAGLAIAWILLRPQH